MNLEIEKLECIDCKGKSNLLFIRDYEVCICEKCHASTVEEIKVEVKDLIIEEHGINFLDDNAFNETFSEAVSNLFGEHLRNMGA